MVSLYIHQQRLETSKIYGYLKVSNLEIGILKKLTHFLHFYGVLSSVTQQTTNSLIARPLSGSPNCAWL